MCSVEALEKREGAREEGRPRRSGETTETREEIEGERKGKGLIGEGGSEGRRMKERKKERE